jgi:hypothetical protein
VKILREFSQLPEVMGELMAMNTNRLFISSGDGTIDAVQTILAESGYARRDLRLGLLAHGTTNMTARDVGMRPKRISAQINIIRDGGEHETQVRTTLRIANARDGIVRHGMFLGAGAVAEAARYSQQALNDRGIGGNLAPFLVLSRSAIKTLTRAPKALDETRIDRPHDITITADGKSFCEGRQLLAMFTTLETLVLGARPFWGDTSGAIRLTVLPYPVPNLLRWIGPVLYGGARRLIPPGAKSGSCNAATIQCHVPYVLDGEFLEGPDDAPLRIERGASFTYIVA